MTKVGEHITLDIIGTTQEYDPSVYENVIRKIAKAAEVTILNISKYKFEPQGFTILALLAESHISFHTFPEKGIISFDFFTCGKVSPSIALDIVKKEFKHKIYASDIDGSSLLNTQTNARRALVFNKITFEKSDFKDLAIPVENATIIINPPYGERLKDEN